MARRPWRLSVKLLITSSVVTVTGFSAICASVPLDIRRGEEELARQALENLASTIDADISRNVELFDLSLRAVASGLVPAVIPRCALLGAAKDGPQAPIPHPSRIAEEARTSSNNGEAVTQG